MRLNDFKDFLAARNMNEDLVGEVRKYLKRLTQDEIDWMMADVHDYLGVFQWQQVQTTWPDFAREHGIRGWVRAMDKMYEWMWAGRLLTDAAQRDDGDHEVRYAIAHKDWLAKLDEIDEMIESGDILIEYWLTIRMDMRD